MLLQAPDDAVPKDAVVVIGESGRIVSFDEHDLIAHLIASYLPTMRSNTSVVGAIGELVDGQRGTKASTAQEVAQRHVVAPPLVGEQYWEEYTD